MKQEDHKILNWDVSACKESGRTVVNAFFRIVYVALGNALVLCVCVCVLTFSLWIQTPQEGAFVFWTRACYFGLLLMRYYSFSQNSYLANYDIRISPISFVIPQLVNVTQVMRI